jgi:hypothetical protein
MNRDLVQDTCHGNTMTRVTCHGNKEKKKKNQRAMGGLRSMRGFSKSAAWTRKRQATPQRSQGAQVQGGVY